MVRVSRSTITERGQERQLSVQLGNRLGFDVRPSRLFVWAGPEREGRERIVSLGRPPARMHAPHRRRWLKIGPAEISYLGNPAITLGLSAWRYTQHWRQNAANAQSKGTSRGGAGA
jgi:hypothetical protein